MKSHAVSSPHDLCFDITLSDKAARFALLNLAIRMEGLDLQCCGSAPSESAEQHTKPESKVPAHDPAALAKMRHVIRVLESLSAQIDQMGEKVRIEAPADYKGAELRLKNHLAEKARGAGVNIAEQRV